VPEERRLTKKANRTQAHGWPDVHPYSPTDAWMPEADQALSKSEDRFQISKIAPLVGLQSAFVKRAVGHGGLLSYGDIQKLLSLDEMAETFVPRSKILAYIAMRSGGEKMSSSPSILTNDKLILCGDAHKLIQRLPSESIDCVVTSTPYWAVRLYGTPQNVIWADGERCPFGHEQTPEAFIRHTIELLYYLKPKMAKFGSIWWNLGDTYHTRTQIRSNAYETLKAMKGLDRRKWTEHSCRRFSGGHSYLTDGGQCLIPQRIAERAARIGYIVKSMISWKKEFSLPEPTKSRVTRSLEYIIHLSTDRNPYFNKAAVRALAPELGGRNPLEERDQVTDVWHFRTAVGKDGHGAQFPLALPGRCIALSTSPDALVLDPFAGTATTGVAALQLRRRFLGFEVSPEYAELGLARLAPELSGQRSVAHTNVAVAMSLFG